MSTPLEDTVEKYFIELLKTDPTLAAFPIKAFDNDDVADSDGIVIEATQKAHRLDGPKGFDVDVRVKFRTTITQTEDERNSISDLIVRTIYGAAPGATTEENNFTYLLILDEMTAERTNTKDLRTRERVLPIIARID